MLAVLASSVAAVVILGACQPPRSQLRPGWNRLVIKTTLKFGLPGYVANVLQFFNYRLDLFLVNYFLGTRKGYLHSGGGHGRDAVVPADAVGFVNSPKRPALGRGHERFTGVFRITLG